MPNRFPSAPRLQPLLAPDDEPGTAADPDTQPMWRDSSMELEQGLDVIELDVDVVLPPGLADT